MNEKQLARMQSAKGFISALDQSGGSTPKALENYGVGPDQYEGETAMFDLVHAMRTRVMTCPAYTADHIIGAIIFENTMEREIEGKKTADYLWEEKGIVPFLKTDIGMREEENGVRLMKDMPGLDALLQKAVEHHIFGTKMRSVILSANAEGIEQVVAQQFARAQKIAGYGLVPIVEPEVDIHATDKAEAEKLLLAALEKHLADFPEPLIFKLTIPDQANLYRPLMDYPQVVRVVALSGGYSREEACRLLAQNEGMIASFSRAFLEGLKADQTDAEFSQTMKDNIEIIYQASMQ